MPLAPQQIRKLKSRLNQRHVRTREVEGRTIAYLEGWHVIAEANRIFGFDGWDRELGRQFLRLHQAAGRALQRRLCGAHPHQGQGRRALGDAGRIGRGGIERTDARTGA